MTKVEISSFCFDKKDTVLLPFYMLLTTIIEPAPWFSPRIRFPNLEHTLVPNNPRITFYEQCLTGISFAAPNLKQRHNVNQATCHLFPDHHVLALEDIWTFCRCRTSGGCSGEQVL
jgi:hypothetical protein